MNYGNKPAFNQNKQGMNQGFKSSDKEQKLGVTIALSKTDAKLYDETAKQVAQNIGVTSTQMRNFYEYVLALLERSKMPNANFAEILPFVKMLNSKVAYAKTRKVASAQFVDMIEQCVKQVNTAQDLQTFKYFFEAVIGFSKK